jgi:hypothetical protein
MSNITPTVAAPRAIDRISLEELRLLYLFFPKDFQWHLILQDKTKYTYINMDALAEEEVIQLNQQLSGQPDPVKKRIVFVLKDFNNMTTTMTLKSLLDDGYDLILEALASREQRREKLERWLVDKPRLAVGWLTFDQEKIQQGNKILPWHAVEYTSMTEDRTFGSKTSYFFFPFKGSGYKTLYQSLKPQEIEPFLAEVDFWRNRSLAPEQAADLEQRRSSQEQRTDAVVMKTVLFMLLGLAGMVCLVMAALVIFAR